MQPVPSFFLEDKQIKRSQGLIRPIRKEKKRIEKENIMQFLYEQKILRAKSWGIANCWSGEYMNSYRWQKGKRHIHYHCSSFGTIFRYFTVGTSCYTCLLMSSPLVSDLFSIQKWKISITWCCFNLFFFLTSSTCTLITHIHYMQCDLLRSFINGK